MPSALESLPELQSFQVASPESPFVVHTCEDEGGASHHPAAGSKTPTNLRLFSLPEMEAQIPVLRDEIPRDRFCVARSGDCVHMRLFTQDCQHPRQSVRLDHDVGIDESYCFAATKLCAAITRVSRA